MEILGWFIFDYILILGIYYFLFVRRTVRGEKVPSEANYLIKIYDLDVNLFSYRKFIKIVGLVTSFDVALVATLVAIVDSRLLWQVLFGLIGVVPVVIISFMLLGKFYKNKQTKDNTKELDKEKKYLEKLNKKDAKKEKKQEERKKKHVK